MDVLSATCLFRIAHLAGDNLEVESIAHYSRYYSLMASEEFNPNVSPQKLIIKGLNADKINSSQPILTFATGERH
jgi:hypothetical protein